MTPAEEFLAARAALGMTQQQLGWALGFSHKRGKVTVCDIERGRQNPSGLAVNSLRLLVAAKTPAGARPTSKLG